MPANASERPDLSKLMQAIYLNEQQVANLMRRIEKRETLFSLRYSERNQHLAYNIIKRRKKEYMDDFHQAKRFDGNFACSGHYVKTPWQMVNHLYEVTKRMKGGENDDGDLNAIKQARRQIHKKSE